MLIVFLIKMGLFLMFPAFPRQKLSAISADKKGTVFRQCCTHLLTSITALCAYTTWLQFPMMDSSGTGSSTQ